MKKLILAIGLLAFNKVNAQVTVVQDRRLYHGNFDIIESVKTNDTLTYLYYGYRNQKYKHIVDIGSILLIEKKSAQEFATSLRNAGNSASGSDLTFKTRYFEIAVYSFSNNVYIMDSKGKHTTISRKEAIKMAEEVESKINLLRR